MKTPDEIKKGLEYCGSTPYCDGDCEYYEGADSCGCKLSNDALAYIKQLESTYSQVSKALCSKKNAALEELLQAVNQLKSRLAQVERERDAAVADITGMLETSDCEVRHVYCSRSTPPFECNADECKGYAKWRGVCEENTKEEK